MWNREWQSDFHYHLHKVTGTPWISGALFVVHVY